MSLLDDVWKQAQAPFTTTVGGTTFYPYGATPHEGVRLEQADRGTPSAAQPPTNPGGDPGAGTGTDPLSTLASAYMASLGGTGGGASQQPVVILPAPATEGAGVNWAAIGALAAVVLLGWVVYRWWKGRHHE